MIELGIGLCYLVFYLIKLLVYLFGELDSIVLVFLYDEINGFFIEL